MTRRLRRALCPLLAVLMAAESVLPAFAETGDVAPSDSGAVILEIPASDSGAVIPASEPETVIPGSGATDGAVSQPESSGSTDSGSEGITPASMPDSDSGTVVIDVGTSVVVVPVSESGFSDSGASSSGFSALDGADNVIIPASESDFAGASIFDSGSAPGTSSGAVDSGVTVPETILPPAKTLLRAMSLMAPMSAS